MPGKNATPDLSAGDALAILLPIEQRVNSGLAATGLPLCPGEIMAGNPRWCLYVVKCKDGTFYTGITNDLRRRIDQHNRGTASRYTRSRLPVELVHREPCRDKPSALRKERRMKSLSRKEKEALFKGTTGT